VLSVTEYLSMLASPCQLFFRYITDVCVSPSGQLYYPWDEDKYKRSVSGAYNSVFGPFNNGYSMDRENRDNGVKDPPIIRKMADDTTCRQMIDLMAAQDATHECLLGLAHA